VLSFLVWSLVEIAIELIVQVPISLGIEAYKEGFSRNNRRPVDATLAYAVLGGLAGLLIVMLFPERLLPDPPIRGASLVLVPIIAGWGMRVLGQFRKARGHTISNLATFHGGAGFAFGAALVRFHFVG